MRDEPRYRDIPLAIGGRSDRRGVIATCNYPARAFGVRSAMATAHALKLCPQLTVIPGNMDKYRAVSKLILSIYHSVTEKVEPLSLDEAYLDVTDSPLFQGSATRIAQMLRAEVEKQTGITISAGVAPNKFLAKIASDWKKPNGLFVITPDQVEEFVDQLPVKKLHGVGIKTAEKLFTLGIHTGRDIKQRQLNELTEIFGQFGHRLYELSRGIDTREVVSERTRKSVSVEHTFAQDLASLDACLAELPELLVELLSRFKKYEANQAIVGFFVKLKFNDFAQTTAEQRATHFEPALFRDLMSEGFNRGDKPVRLLGVGFRLEDKEGVSFEQLSLWP